MSNNVVCATSKGSDQPAHTRRLITAFACHLDIILLLAAARTAFGVPTLKGGTQAPLSLHMSKCHIVGNHMSRHNYLNHMTLPSHAFIIMLVSR